MIPLHTHSSMDWVKLRVAYQKEKELNWNWTRSETNENFTSFVRCSNVLELMPPRITRNKWSNQLKFRFPLVPSCFVRHAQFFSNILSLKLFFFDDWLFAVRMTHINQKYLKCFIVRFFDVFGVIVEISIRPVNWHIVVVMPIVSYRKSLSLSLAHSFLSKFQSLFILDSFQLI